MILTSLAFILILFLFIGIVFCTLAVIGLFRFPDAYTRLHAGTKCTTLGSIFIILSVVTYGIGMTFNRSYVLYSDFWILSMHAFIAMLCILITNPVGAHAIALAAHKSGVYPTGCQDNLKKSQGKKQNKKHRTKKK